MASLNGVRFGTLNVNGLCDAGKQDQVKKFVFDNGTDILFIQETHFENFNETKSLNIPGDARWAFGTNKSCGVVIYYKIHS